MLPPRGEEQVERSLTAEGGWVEWLGVVEEVERAHPLADQRDQLEEIRWIKLMHDVIRLHMVTKYHHF